MDYFQPGILPLTKASGWVSISPEGRDVSYGPGERRINGKGITSLGEG